MPSSAREAMVSRAASMFFDQAGARPAVIAERVERGGGGRVDRIGPDQIFDVAHVRVSSGVLGPVLGPEQSLRLRAACSRAPASAGR